MKVAALITFTPGTVISRRISGERSASVAIRCSIAAISDSQKSSWRRQPSTVSCSSAGSSSDSSQRRPLTPKRSETAGFLTSLRISAAWISFFALVRTDQQLAAALKAPAHRPGLLVGHPDRSQRSRRQELRQGAGVEAVGLRPGRADAGVGG